MPFVLKFFAAAITLATGLLAVQIFVLRDERLAEAFAQLEYKNQKALGIAAPTVVFQGGISSFYAIKAQAMVSESGLAGINYAIAGDFSLKTLTEALKKVVKPKDLVVLVPEYVHYRATGNWAKDDFHWIRLYDRKRLNEVAFNTLLSSAFKGNVLNQILATTLYYGNQLIKAGGSSHQPSETDPAGDYQRCEDTYHGDVGDIWLGSPSPEALKVLAQFQRWIKEQEATLIVSFPPLARTPAYDDPTWLKGADQLVSSLKSAGLSIWQQPTTFLYPPAQFCHTYNQLGTAAALDYSQKLFAGLGEQRLARLPLKALRRD